MISKFGFQRLKKGALKYLVLECLNEKPMRTYEIIKSIEKKFEGSYRPSTGSIYPVLKGLVEKDLVEVKVENGKKIYIITDKGKKELEEIKNKSLKLLGDNAKFSRPILQELLQIAFYLYNNRSKIDENNIQKIIQHLRNCRNELRDIL
ncbi:PadR family transcriptional regulator [Saccharolobus islandicus]|uniref:Transcriptional regulator PadR family protein n=1 Tax=Saccharolobus islandicus (strain L.D.8.5 / Lassen \|nr:PadR family transcriptional regulator [Sulfolobus islandicus]ADB87987.1 transcriptional regulator PadR family protein [Sulfolobus islandicus L.D.8.5]